MMSSVPNQPTVTQPDKDPSTADVTRLRSGYSLRPFDWLLRFVVRIPSSEGTSFFTRAFFAIPPTQVYSIRALTVAMQMMLIAYVCYLNIHSNQHQ